MAKPKVLYYLEVKPMTREEKKAYEAARALTPYRSRRSRFAAKGGKFTSAAGMQQRAAEIIRDNPLAKIKMWTTGEIEWKEYVP